MMIASFTLVLLVGATPSSDTEPVRAVEACPALFGNDEIRGQIADRQATAVEAVQRTRYQTTLVHHVGRWRPPTSARLHGITVAGVDRVRGEILLDLAADAFPNCPAGRYRVPSAIALGREDRVIALLDDAVLVERGRGLVLLVEDGAPVPKLDLIWRSPYEIVREVSAAAPATSKRKDVVSAAKPAAPEALRAASTRTKPASPRKRGKN